MPAGNLTPNLHVSGGGEVVIPMQRVDDPYTNISDVSFTHSSSHLLMEAYPFHFVSWRCLLCVSFFLLVCVMWCFFSLLCIWFVFRINSIAYIISDVSFIVFMCCFISFQNSCVCVSFFLLVCFFSVCLWFIVVFLFITLCRFTFRVHSIAYSFQMCVVCCSVSFQMFHIHLCCSVSFQMCIPIYFIFILGRYYCPQKHHQQFVHKVNTSNRKNQESSFLSQFHFNQHRRRCSDDCTIILERSAL